MIAFWFDIDDTLYSRRDLLLEAAREVTPPGEVLGEERFMHVFMSKSDENFPDVQSGRISAWESNVWRLEETFRELGISFPSGAGETFANRYTYLQEHITLSPVLTRMMEELTGAHIFLGVLTNGPSDHQWNKYRALGLSRWIPEEHVVVSGDVGASKPDPAIFRAAEEKTGNAAYFVQWMIGDSVSHDIAGAKQAGWHTIWMNRGVSDDAGKGVSDRIVHSENELAKACAVHLPT